MAPLARPYQRIGDPSSCILWPCGLLVLVLVLLVVMVVTRYIVDGDMRTRKTHQQNEPSAIRNVCAIALVPSILGSLTIACTNIVYKISLLGCWCFQRLIEHHPRLIFTAARIKWRDRIYILVHIIAFYYMDIVMKNWWVPFTGKFIGWHEHGVLFRNGLALRGELSGWFKCGRNTYRNCALSLSLAAEKYFCPTSRIRIRGDGR